MFWFIIAIILTFLFLKTRSELRELRNKETSSPAATLAESRLSAAQQDLIVLRLELTRRLKVGAIDQAFYQQLTEQIDAQWGERYEETWVGGDFWQQTCQRAWNQLAARGRVPPGLPPWERPQPSLAAEPATSPGVTVSPAVETPVPPLPAPTPASGEPPSVSPATIEEPRLEPDYAWQPQQPGALEQALHALAGWPRALLPFLVQNIGWFIGGFCFLAGSIFLVSYTSGFTKGLVVFAALLAFTLALLWGGYQLRRRQPALEAGSTVLLTLGILLVPLNLSVLARLLVTADSGWLLIVSLLATLLALAVFFFASQVIAGIMDRTLQGEQPRLYLALASVQLALPLLAYWPAWPLLALLHALLLGLLAYGLWRYAHDWMYSIFVERRRIAYFAAGTLLYAALISFIHLTWGAAPLAVPTGYYAPYLMAVCGLLFYLDTHFKEWVHHYAFLSRFSFLIYGLSVLAVVLARDAPLARLLTLTLGAVLYGAVAWHYLTLVPLCLLLACLGGIYGQLVLSHFPAEQHFLWSLPGLAGIRALSRWMQNLANRRPGAYPLALLSYRLLVALVIVLTGWSLYHAQPGWMAMTTALTTAGGLWWLLRAAPGPLLSEPADDRRHTPLDLCDSPWLYTVVLATTAAAAWTPAWIDLRLEWRFALELMLLAWLWVWLALGSPRTKGPRLTQTEVFTNSALLSVVAGLGIAIGLGLEGPDRSLPILLFSLGAVPLLWLSLGLYVRWLFYGFLILTAGAAVLAKLLLFPGPSSGGIAWLAGMGIWMLLWWLDRQPAEAEALRRARIPRPLTLLGVISLPGLNTGAIGEAQDLAGDKDV